jgi:hypothetical protein
VAKQSKTLLIIAAVVIGGWAVYKLYQNWKANGGTFGGTFGQLGTNLNSIAPELVGGSQGPQAGPGVNMPVNITLTEQTSSQEPPSTAMVPAGQSPDNPMGVTSPSALTQANPIPGSYSTNNYEDNSNAVTGQPPLMKQPPNDSGNGNGKDKDKDRKDRRDRDKDRR